jgi:class 3 adenylate cyclase
LLSHSTLGSVLTRRSGEVPRATPLDLESTDSGRFVLGPRDPAERGSAETFRSARAIDLQIRVAIHTGEVDTSGGDARGLAVHAAARILGLAGPDEVLISSTTADLLDGSGLVLEDAGSHDLKGISGPRRILRLVQPGG